MYYTNGGGLSPERKFQYHFVFGGSGLKFKKSRVLTRIMVPSAQLGIKILQSWYLYPVSRNRPANMLYELAFRAILFLASAIHCVQSSMCSIIQVQICFLACVPCICYSLCSNMLSCICFSQFWA
jgi:hypothetical protein